MHSNRQFDYMLARNFLFLIRVACSGSLSGETKLKKKTCEAFAYSQ